jgi:hypothetical protein
VRSYRCELSVPRSIVASLIALAGVVASVLFAG